MHSPIARGLFHRAITQSGGIMNPWADPPNKGVAKSRAIKLARLMNCSTDISTKEIIECLRNVDADKILSAVYDFYVRKLPILKNLNILLNLILLF